MESFAFRGGAYGSQSHYGCLDDETYLLPLMATIHMVLTTKPGQGLANPLTRLPRSGMRNLGYHMHKASGFVFP